METLKAVKEEGVIPVSAVLLAVQTFLEEVRILPFFLSSTQFYFMSSVIIKFFFIFSILLPKCSRLLGIAPGDSVYCEWGDENDAEQCRALRTSILQASHRIQFYFVILYHIISYHIISILCHNMTLYIISQFISSYHISSHHMVDWPIILY